MRSTRLRRYLNAAARVVATAAILCTWPCGAASEDEPRDRYREPVDYGPYRVEMQRVIEGYRSDLRWREGPGARRNGRFRLSNVQTPGIHVERSCEKTLGYEAKEFVEQFVRGKNLTVRDIRRGRDNRTWVGRLEADGADLSQALLDEGLAAPYNDSSRNPARRSWICPDEDTDPFDILKD